MSLCYVPLFDRELGLKVQSHLASASESALVTQRGQTYVTNVPLVEVCSGLGSQTPTVVVSMDT